MYVRFFANKAGCWSSRHKHSPGDVECGCKPFIWQFVIQSSIWWTGTHLQPKEDTYILLYIMHLLRCEKWFQKFLFQLLTCPVAIFRFIWASSRHKWYGLVAHCKDEFMSRHAMLMYFICLSWTDWEVFHYHPWPDFHNRVLITIGMWSIHHNKSLVSPRIHNYEPQSRPH